MRDGLCVGCLCGPQFSVGVSDAQSLRHRCYHFKMKYKDTLSVIVIFFLVLYVAVDLLVCLVV